MNALDKASPKHETQLSNNGPLFDLDFFIKKPEEAPAPSPARAAPGDDVMVDITDAGLNNNNGGSPLDDILDLGLTLDNDTKCDKTETPVGSKDNVNGGGDHASEVKPLTDIDVSLASVRPSAQPPVTAFEEAGGLTVVLHFCEDRPRPDVSVIVVSTTSKHTSPIEDYKFQAVVPKVSLL